MKVSICLFVVIFLFGCKKAHEGISDCICVAKDTSDSIITITNPVFETKDNQNFISYNCAEVEVATASVTDTSGNESCENLVNVKCISNKTYSLKLASKLNYTSTKFKELNSTDESDKRFLINELNNNTKQIFELNIDKQREILSIKKFEKQ
ncbi:hypothetical protein [Epilithonimonas hungarica]|uniref:Lipoprotein n=1 Tax=Epilithonimonas hungarica TaxID=454006 RepID=A0A1G7GUU0_9FLAO|nr:hypothetical protein [Epilithonimonas hungarica]SDE91875.1 hypothetical protein SAMN05421825_0582 [Epilithonimonas hungarica]